MSEIDLRALRARHSLRALQLGDAFGERFFGRGAKNIEARRLPPEPLWRYTDDTAEAAVLTRHLLARGSIDPAALALEWAEEHHQEPWRGYGGGAHRLFEAVHQGAPWRETAQALFHGSGSKGNGSAMRVAPLGAYFADDIALAASQAALSAEPTHLHPEGIAGAVATAVAAAAVGAGRCDFWELVLAHTPPSRVRVMIERARSLGDVAVEQAVRELGSGQEGFTYDTVPFCLWIAARHRHDPLDEALWSTVSGYGDRDTTCAIVGGILGAQLTTALPAPWLAHLEPLEV